MRLIGVLILLVVTATTLIACGGAYGEVPASEPHTAFVVVDPATLAELGPFPIERRYYARALSALAVLGARGAVLKFFFDRETQSDRELAESMRLLPVFLQYRLVADGEGSRGLPAEPTALDVALTNDPLIGHSGWHPVAVLAREASGVGFVDARTADVANGIEVVGIDGNRPVASLLLRAASAALGRSGSIEGRKLRIGDRGHLLNARGQLGCDVLSRGRPRVWSLLDLLHGNVPAAAVSGKVVVLGYIGDDAPTLPVGGGRELPAHELFYRQLLCIVGLYQ